MNLDKRHVKRVSLVHIKIRLAKQVVQIVQLDFFLAKLVFSSVHRVLWGLEQTKWAKRAVPLVLVPKQYKAYVKIAPLECSLMIKHAKNVPEDLFLPLTEQNAIFVRQISTQTKKQMCARLVPRGWKQIL